jgi:hypothetical protein
MIDWNLNIIVSKNSLNVVSTHRKRMNETTNSKNSVCQSPPKYSLIIIVVIIYYIITFLLWPFLGTLWVALVSFVPFSLGLLFVFGSASCENDRGRENLINYGLVFAIASVISAMVYIIFVLLYRYSKNRILAFMVTLLVTFVLSIMTWVFLQRIIRFNSS